MGHEGNGVAASHPKSRSPGTDREDTAGRDHAILVACQEPSNLGDVSRVTELPRSSVHRRLHRLVDDGLLAREGHLYRLTAAGAQQVNGPHAPEAALPGSPELFPAMVSFPSLLHKAVGRLALFAHVARRDGLVDDRHPGIILMGGTQRLKSWLVKALCFLTGTTPDRCRVPLMSIRGRGMLTRLNSKGKKTYELLALREPIVWCEEFSLTDTRVKRDIEALLHGTRSVTVENESVEVEGVPIIEMNPRDGETLEGKIGLDAPRLRRCLIADFSEVHISSKTKAESSVFLKHIETRSPAYLPSAPRDPLGSACQELLDSAFAECVLPDRMDYVDPSRIATLIAGARAFLPETEALFVVLSSYFTLASTTGFVHRDWYERLARLRSVTGQANPVPAPLVNAGPHGLPTPPRVNPYDLAGGLLGMKNALESCGYCVPEDQEKISHVIEVARKLDEEGLEPTQVGEVLGEVKTLEGLRAEIVALGSSEEQIRSLNQMQGRLDELGIGCDVTVSLAESLVAIHDEHPALRPAVQALVHLAERGLVVQEWRKRLRKQIGDLEAQHEGLEEQIEQAKTLLRQYHAACVRKHRQWKELNERARQLYATLPSLRTEAKQLFQQIDAMRGAVE